MADNNFDTIESDYLHNLEISKENAYAHCLAEAESILKLDQELQNSDSALSYVQEMLYTLKMNVSTMSSDIQNIQLESNRLQLGLENRKMAEMGLQNALKQYMVSKSSVSVLEQCQTSKKNAMDFISSNGKEYVNMLEEVEKVASYSVSHVEEQMAAQKEWRNLVQQYALMANQQCLAYFDAVFDEFRQYHVQNVNIQTIQQRKLVPLKRMLGFVGQEKRILIKAEYVEIMHKILFDVFHNYHVQLMKLLKKDSNVLSKMDLIVIDKHAVSMFAQKVYSFHSFQMEHRESILNEVTAPPIIIHLAQAEKLQLSFEQVYQGFHQHLMNAATAEYLFLLDFFDTSDQQVFMSLFANTISFALEALENHLFNCYDIVGLLLLIRLTQEQEAIMEQRRVPCLRKYFERVYSLLQPRLELVLEQNIASITKANVKKLSTVDLQGHECTRRYAEFISSMLRLYKPKRANGKDAVTMQIVVMRDAMVGLLNKIAAHHHRLYRSQVIFLINNYDLIVQTLLERHVDSEHVIFFEELLVSQRETFLEVELQDKFVGLVSFLRTAESATDESKIDHGSIDKIAEAFKRDWKKKIDAINSTILTSFANFKNGTEILKLLLAQLLLYYTRFVELMRKHTKASSSLKHVVSTKDILNEIKSYSRSF